MSDTEYIIRESFKRFSYDPALAYFVAALLFVLLPFIHAGVTWELRYMHIKLWYLKIEQRRLLRQLGRDEP